MKNGRWLVSALGASRLSVRSRADHILTDLRESLDTPTSDKLRSVLARNLTKIPDHEMEPQ